MLRLLVVLNFEESEQRELVPALRGAWKSTVISALEDGRPRAWFEVNVLERAEMPELVDRFMEERTRISGAAAEIEEIRNQLVDAKFTARASLKARETQKTNEINSANQELEMIRVEAAHYLVPDGRSLDDLMEDEQLSEEAKFDLNQLDGQAVLELEAAVSGRKVDERMIAHSAETESSLESTAGDQQSVDPLLHAQHDPERESEAGFNQEDSTKVGDDVHESTKTPRSAETLEEKQLRQEEASAAAKSEDFAEELDFEADATMDEKEEVVSLDNHTSFGIPASVDQALKHLHWTESAEEAQKAFRIAYDQYAQVPRYVVESVALHWISAGHLNVAAQILRDASDSTLVGDRVLDSALLRSAFYGLNFWPKDREALSFTQRDLNLLNHKDLEEQLERKPTGKIVPYLLVCATLQPALFAGGQTQAATFLRLAADHFDGHLSRLLSDTAEFSLRSGRVDLDLLRNDQVTCPGKRRPN